MASRNETTIEDVLYDRVIDVLQNGARDNDLRDRFDEYMGERQYNNKEFNELLDHATRIFMLNEHRCRDQRDVEDLIIKAADEAVSQMIGVWATNDRDISDAIDDNRLWRALQDGARDFERTVRDFERANDRGGRSDVRGGGRRDDRRDLRERDRYRDDNRRDNRRYDTRREDRQQSARMGGGLSSVRPAERDDPRDDRRDVRREERRPVEQTHARSAPREERVLDVVTGPDMSKSRPWDHFLGDNGEIWELAHVSKMAWVSTPDKFYCRHYDPETEVRFLVKDTKGNVREEFLPMSDDLTFAKHEIRQLANPNRVDEPVKARSDQEQTMPGADPDAIDLDQFSEQAAHVRAVFTLSDLNIKDVEYSSAPEVDATVEAGMVKVTATRLKGGKDVAAIAHWEATPVVTTGKGVDELMSLESFLGTEATLKSLHERLLTLRGKVDEHVLDKIDAHFAHVVNHASRHMFGLGKANIDSFLNDFPAMMKWLAKTRGESWLNQYFGRSRPLVYTMTVASEGIKDTALENQELLLVSEMTGETLESLRKATIVLIKPAALVSVGITADQFGLVNDHVTVPEIKGPSADPELAEVLKQLYAIGRKAIAAGPLYVVTADFIKLELVPAVGARDWIGVRRAD